MKILKEREKKIAMQGRDLEKAIETLNCKLREDDSPKLLKVDFNFKLYEPTAYAVKSFIYKLYVVRPV